MKRLAKFNGVKVGELSVNLLADPRDVRVKAAFVDSERGDTYGWTMRSGWSEQTERTFRAFLASLEADLERAVFADGDDDGGTVVAAGPAGAPTGLGEHLGGPEPVPQGQPR